MWVRLYPCPVSITAVGVSIADLKSSVDLSAVKHEDEVLKVSQGRLPGDVISFLWQVFGASQGQCCIDYFGPTKQKRLIPPKDWQWDTLKEHFAG